jgi:hypothetical protein
VGSSVKLIENYVKSREQEEYSSVINEEAPKETEMKIHLNVLSYLLKREKIMGKR